MLNLRQSRRIDTKINVQFQYFGKLRNGILLNFSKTGLFIKSNTLPEINEEIKVIFRFKNNISTFNYKVVRVQNLINKNIEKKTSLPKGFGLHCINNKNAFNDLIQHKPIAKHSINERVFTYEKVIEFSDIGQLCNFYTNQVTRLNIVFNSNANIKTNSFVKVFLRNKQPNFTLDIIGKSLKTIKNEQGLYFTYLEIDYLDFKHIQSKLDLFLKQNIIHKNSALPLSGIFFQHNFFKILLNILKKKYTGIIELYKKTNLFSQLHFKDGFLLYINTGNNYDFIRFLQKNISSIDLNKFDINKISNYNSSLEIRDSLIRTFGIPSHQAYKLWEQYLLNLIEKYFLKFDLQFKFKPTSMKEIIALNTGINFIENVFSQLKNIDIIFLKNFINFSNTHYFTIKKKQMYLWPKPIIQYQSRIDENKIYTFETFTKDLKQTHKNALCCIIYLFYIEELSFITQQK